MTAHTPEQLRALADAEERSEEHMSGLGFDTDHERAIVTALRAAADQLEAVQAWADHADPVCADLSGLYAIITTDTARQDGRVMSADLTDYHCPTCGVGYASLRNCLAHEKAEHHD